MRFFSHSEIKWGGVRARSCLKMDLGASVNYTILEVNKACLENAISKWYSFFKAVILHLGDTPTWLGNCFTKADPCISFQNLQFTSSAVCSLNTPQVTLEQSQGQEPLRESCPMSHLLQEAFRHYLDVFLLQLEPETDNIYNILWNISVYTVSMSFNSRGSLVLFSGNSCYQEFTFQGGQLAYQKRPYSLHTYTYIYIPYHKSYKSLCSSQLDQ